MSQELSTTNNYASLKNLLCSENCQSGIAAVTAHYLNAEAVASAAYQCALKTPQLLQVPAMEFVSAVKTLAQMGCMPDGIHGYLVPRKNHGKLQCVPVPSARGLLRMAGHNGIRGVCANVVREGDGFTWRVKDGVLEFEHVPDVFGSGEMRGVYCVWQEDGGMLHGVAMSKAEVDKIKAISVAQNGPWLEHYEQMALKTVIKRAAKQWPLPYAIESAMQDADEVEFERGAVRNVTPVVKRREVLPFEMPSVPADDEPAFQPDSEPDYDVPDAEPDYSAGDYLPGIDVPETVPSGIDFEH